MGSHMNNKVNFQSTKVIPSGDGRWWWRVNKSITLWVVNRSWSKDKTRVEVCGVIESIERTVYRIRGKNGEWVQYYGHYHPLHTVEEFSEILTDAKNGKYQFFNNALRGHGEGATHTEPALFIYSDEPGPTA